MDEGLAVTARPLVQGGESLEVKPGVCSAGLAFFLQIEEQTVRMEEEPLHRSDFQRQRPAMLFFPRI